MIDCSLLCVSNTGGLRQLYAGFGILQKRGLINARFLKSKQFKSYGKQLLSVSINNTFKLVYDTADHDRVYHDELVNCDLYFKRSYNRHTHQRLSKKIFPLGLNYPVYGENDRAAKLAFWGFIEQGSSSMFNRIADLAASSAVLSHAFSNAGRHALSSQAFEGLPRYDLSPKVLFLTQVWDPARPGLNAEQSEERATINVIRAECVRKLRKEFGPSFIGGLSSNDFARQNFPDCVVGPALTKKVNYLRTLRESGIGIATMGLDRSNGWKLAEYVAGAKAIVSETLRYEVPGDFTKGTNYLAFETPDECVQSAVGLFADPQERYRMMCENHSYYHRYLRPDILVWNTLQQLARELHSRLNGISPPLRGKR